MSTLKAVTLAAAFFGGATSLTMAQGLNSNNGMPPASYKRPGAYSRDGEQWPCWSRH